MVTDAITEAPPRNTVYYGDSRRMDRYPKPSEEHWTVTNQIEATIQPEGQYLPCNVTLEERQSNTNPDNRTVMLVVSKVQQTDRLIHGLSQEIPLGDYLSEEYWQMDEFNGLLTAMHVDTQQILRTVSAWVANDSNTSLHWIRESDRMSTFEVAEAYYAEKEHQEKIQAKHKGQKTGTYPELRRSTIKQEVEIDLPGGLKAFVHTHIREPIGRDHIHPNPYVRTGYRYLLVNICEDVNAGIPEAKPLYKRILLPNQTKLREIKLPIEQWNTSRDEIQATISLLTDKIHVEDLDRLFERISSEIRVFLPDAN